VPIPVVEMTRNNPLIWIILIKENTKVLASPVIHVPVVTGAADVPVANIPVNGTSRRTHDASPGHLNTDVRYTLPANLGRDLLYQDPSCEGSLP
jgi:hypothetical protein